MHGFRRHADLWLCLLLCLLALGITLPFLNHAYHVDEPLFLRVARQILSDPWNPYGFQYLWDNEPKPMSQIAAFPPLFAYFLAAVGGGREFPPEARIHLSLVPFACVALLSFYLVARKLGHSPVWSFFAAALWACSPAFVVSANLAMPDVAGIACSLLALAICLGGWQNNRTAPLLAGGVLLGLALLMRYNTAPLLPVFVLLGWSYGAGRRGWIPAILAAALLAAWLVWSKKVAFQSHSTQLFSTFFGVKEALNRFWALNNALSLATFLPFLWALLVWPKGPFWPLFSLVVGIYYGAFASKAEPIVGFEMFPDFVFFSLGFFTLAYLATRLWADLRRLAPLDCGARDSKGQGPEWFLALRPEAWRRDPEAFREAVLILWVFAALAVPLVYVHFASKYLLYAQPPLILLALKALTAVENRWRKPLAALLPAGLALSLAVAHADFRLADVYRRKAHEMTSAYFPWRGNLWFMGHWGWQYYLEKEGIRPLPATSFGTAGLKEGDVILRAAYASPQPIFPSLHERIQIRKYVPVFEEFPLRTMNQQARAGFYSNIWGPLPFSVSDFALENIAVYDVVR